MLTRTATRYLVPVLTFALLAASTAAVWRRQVEHDQALLAAHTEDVCLEVARRLEVYVTSRLKVAAVFAKRWATHSGRDFSRQRFEEFAAVLVDELPGYHAVGLLPPGGGEGWVVPAGHALLPPHLLPTAPAAPAPNGPGSGIRVSAAMEVHPGDAGFFAALPLVRDAESLGLLVVEFRATTLVKELFEPDIRSEFNLVVEDGDGTLFRHAPELAEGVAVAALPLHSSRTFPVHDRTWRLTVAPREAALAASGWRASAPVPLLGLALSVGLSTLVFMLLGRISAHRQARDDALREVVERRRTEEALRASEAQRRQAMRQRALLSRRILAAQEEERARVSRDLHDGLGQLLTALRLDLDWLAKQPSGAPPALGEAASLVDRAARELRDICRGLRPPLLDDLGLEPAVRQLVEEFEERAAVPVDLEVLVEDDQTPVPPDVALCAYRVLQEALTNVGRHSGARKVGASLAVDQEDLVLTVQDDGSGFDVSVPPAGFGIAGMRERAEFLGGTIDLHASPGQGTQVVLRVPLATQSAEETP